MSAGRQKTKIIATLGDPDADPSTYRSGVCDLRMAVLEQPTLDDVVQLFFRAAIDVLRINLAHMHLKDMESKFLAIKEAVLRAEEEHGRKIGVLADLPGPKIRFREKPWLVPKRWLRITFDRGQENLVDADDPSRDAGPESTALIWLDEQPFAEASPQAADAILSQVDQKLKDPEAEKPVLAFVGDNDATLMVDRVEGRQILCRVVTVASEDRVIGKSKGFTIRSIAKPVAAFTKQDRRKLSKLLTLDYEGSPVNPIVSHVGISFCQTRDDAREVLHHTLETIGRLTGSTCLSDRLVKAPLLIAKIETGEGVKRIDEIVDFADGAMVARGDLALEVPTASIPAVSKHIINHCNLRGKPVIMATQMLESMRTNIECSRTEATDVFNAVADGADALLLSGETSSGMYPVHAIMKMQELAKEAETFLVAKTPEDIQIQAWFNKLEAISHRVEDWQKQDHWDKIWSHYATRSGGGALSDEELVFVRSFVNEKNERLRKQNSTDRISHAACVMAADPTVEAIVAPTTSGRTARMLARFRPRAWIHAQPHSVFVGRKVTVDWGVVGGEIIDVTGHSDDANYLMNKSKVAIQREAQLAGKPVVFICGTPLGQVGTTNLIQRWDRTAEAR